MTNGEKLEQVFPDGICPFSKSWLDHEYKEPSTKINQDLTKNKSEISTGSTTKNDLVVDCVSRQSVLDKIQRLINAEQNNIDENGDYMNYARERVNAYEGIQFFVYYLCPSVTPIRPKGHWIPIYQGDEIIGYRCSECEFGNTFGKGTIGMNFCPNCGADNREVEE